MIVKLVSNKSWCCEAGKNQTQWQIPITLTWQMIGGIEDKVQGQTLSDWRYDTNSKSKGNKVDRVIESGNRLGKRIIERLETEIRGTGDICQDMGWRPIQRWDNGTRARTRAGNYRDILVIHSGQCSVWTRSRDRDQICR